MANNGSRKPPSANKTPAGALQARVYMVRHGDTDFNSGQNGPERFRAWADLPLNDKGFQSAHEAGNFLADKGIGHIFHSDLIRNEQTAQVLHAYTGAPVTPVHGLRPWNVGDLSGQPVEPNLKMVQEYQDKKPNTPLPGGESYNEFDHRWTTTFHSLLHYSANVGQPIALVTHTRNLNNLRAKMESRKAKIHSEQPPGGILRVDVRGGKLKLIDEDASEGMKDESKPQE